MLARSLYGIPYETLSFAKCEQCEIANLSFGWNCVYQQFFLEIKAPVFCAFFIYFHLLCCFTGLGFGGCLFIWPLAVLTTIANSDQIGSVSVVGLHHNKTIPKLRRSQWTTTSKHFIAGSWAEISQTLASNSFLVFWLADNSMSGLSALLRIHEIFERLEPVWEIEQAQKLIKRSLRKIVLLSEL